MNSGFRSQCIPQYSVLDDAQIRRIHSATLELLETAGVRVLDPEAVELMAGAGCRVKPGNIVRIPNWLVEDCIRSAPSRITIYDRTGREAMRLENSRIHYGPGTDLVNTRDLESGDIRQSRLQDVANAAKIVDALPELDFSASYALPFDSPVNMGYIDSFKAQLENTVKPIFFTAGGVEDLAVINDMAQAAVGGPDVLRESPMHIHYAEPLTPLAHSAGAVRKLFYCADHLIPVTYTPGMMSGGTAPVTLAGAITLGNAEALSGIVMHQLRKKGAPIISGFGIATLDMRTAGCIYGCPEYRLASSACAALYRHYGIPMWGTAGVSDAQCLDEQAGMEWGISLLTAALDGANLIHDVGYLGQGLTGDPAGLIVCAEMISYVKHLIRGFRLDDIDIALDTIREVGPQGHFLSSRHTRQHFRTEHWLPNISNRLPLKSWQDLGAKTMAGTAADKARTILREHTVQPLAEGVQARLDGLREKALADLGNMFFET